MRPAVIKEGLLHVWYTHDSGIGCIYGLKDFCFGSYLPQILTGAQQELERGKCKVKKRGTGTERVHLEERKKLLESFDPRLSVAYLEGNVRGE